MRGRHRQFLLQNVPLALAKDLHNRLHARRETYGTNIRFRSLHEIRLPTDFFEEISSYARSSREIIHLLDGEIERYRALERRKSRAQTRGRRIGRYIETLRSFQEEELRAARQEAFAWQRAEKETARVLAKQTKVAAEGLQSIPEEWKIRPSPSSGVWPVINQKKRAA